MGKSDARVHEAERVIRKHALMSLVVGAVPVPALDLVALAGVQVDLVRRLAEAYEVEFSQEAGRTAVAALLGSSFPVSVASHLATLAKGVPGLGSVVGGIGRAIVGAASTYAVGKVFVQHFESGNTILTLDPQKVRAYYSDEVERGKSAARRSYAGIEP